MSDNKNVNQDKGLQGNESLKYDLTHCLKSDITTDER